MRIDCAVSLCDRAKFSYGWDLQRDYTAADLTAILSRNRFEGAVTIAQTADPGETDWLLGLAASHSWIVGVVTQVDDPRHWDRWQANLKFLGVELASPLLAAELESRELVCVTRLAGAAALLDSAAVSRLVVRATAGLSFASEEFQAWAETVAPLRSSQALIQIDGLLEHAGPAGWQAATYQPWVRHLLASFGSERILFGSGWPLSMPHHTWKESLACFTQAMGARTMAERALILGENAAKYYPRRVRVGYT